MFTTFPTYSPYRPLGPNSPALQGEDVYALQTALNHLNFPCGVADGVFGGRTLSGVKDAQTALKLEVDGVVGTLTWRTLTLAISRPLCDLHRIPRTANKGQLERESSYLGGNYSPRRPEGDYDAGIAQRNTAITIPQTGFNMPESIEALSKHTRKHFDLFEGVSNPFRRWSLAQGAWNAPAFACYLARAEGAKRVTAGMTLKPSAESLRIFEEYMSRASVYLTL